MSENDALLYHWRSSVLSDGLRATTETETARLELMQSSLPQTELRPQCVQRLLLKPLRVMDVEGVAAQAARPIMELAYAASF